MAQTDPSEPFFLLLIRSDYLAMEVGEHSSQGVVTRHEKLAVPGAHLTREAKREL
jgi:hypothetical protein